MKPDTPLATDYSRAATLAQGLQAVATRYQTGTLLPGTFLSRLVNDPMSLGAGPPAGSDVGVTGLASAVRVMAQSRSHFADAVNASAVRVMLATDKTQQADV